MKLSETVKLLKEAGIEDARHEARLIFSEFTDIPASELYGNDPSSHSDELIDAVKRRSRREPLQYIIGRVDFYRESYRVTKDCLIPRSDTEILVEEAVKRLPEGARFVDVCTGSGCVALSTLNNTKNTTAAAIDVSPSALTVARKNAEALSLLDRIDFIEADALKSTCDGEFFAVISNPPYVTPGAYSGLAPEIYFEPSIAFLGGEDGLDFYRAIISLYENKISEGGFFAFEIGYDQADALCDLAKNHGMSCEIIKDYSDNPRVAILKK